jgi:hypothetical protein
VAPLLALQQLQQLQLSFDDQTPSGAQLTQLTGLSALTELQLVYSSTCGYDAAAADAWAVLPLCSLKFMNWAAPHISGKAPMLRHEVVGRLHTLTQLTCLEVGVPVLCDYPGVNVLASPMKLAAALAPLTGLQQLQLIGCGCLLPDGPTERSRRASSILTSYHHVWGVQALLDALAGLKRMRHMLVDLPLAMLNRHACQANKAAKRMPSWVARARVHGQGLLVEV